MDDNELPDVFSSLDAELSARSGWLPNVDSLDFVNDPAKSGPYQCKTPDQLVRPNIGLHALKATPKNHIFLEHESRLCDILRTLESMDATEARETLEDRVIQELIRINRLKEIEWSGQQSKHGIEGAVVSTECHFADNHPKDTTLIAIFMTTLVMYILYRLPRRGVIALLSGMVCILKSQPSLVPLVNEVPKDPRRILTLYHLDPVTQSYVCCPECHCLYPHSVVETKKRKASALSGENPNPMESAEGDTIGEAPFVSSTPENCSYRCVRSGATCGEPLFDPVIINGNTHTVPRLQYYAQDLKQWVGWLLSRPTIEEEVSKAFRRPRKEQMEDMWDAKHLCRILLKKGERFLPGPVDETRLAFSFSMDSFNPYHMKEAKQTVSSTAIWLILLNLPSHLRYRPENMFLAGIIPGPRKPSLSNVNHSIKLLVDVLLEFFDPGIWYSRTAKHRRSYRVRAILIPIVSDMPAARQAGGFASPTATLFCTLCSLKIQDIENIDRRTWPERDVGEHIQFARQWRDAQTTKEQEALFKEHGIRWSALLDLPYWNPIVFTAIEPMHVFDAGLFQTHCRHVWGIDTTASSGDGLTPQSAMGIPRPSDSELGEWYEVIRKLKRSEDLRERLKDCARNTLWHICSDNDLRRAGKKPQLAEAIVEWRQMVSPDTIRYPIVRSTEPNEVAVSASFTPQTDVSDAESQRSLEGSVATDDSTASVRALQCAIDKCIKQLNDRASPKTVLRAKKIVLKHVCRDYCLMTEDELNNLHTKDELYAAAAAWVDEHVLFSEKSGQGRKTAPKTVTGAILGKDVMEAIWADMKHTELPSWVTNVPHNWGTAARGKLSANNWRVICTVHLPITLIRLWGGDDAPEDRKRKLKNFMDLVCAVQIANLRSISKNDIELYEHYIYRYLTGFKTLYKLATVKPIHHAALHYGDILRGFGPAHTHGAAFYERYIHSMQSKNHNMKLGELELTFMRSSAREAKLQALLLDHGEVRERVDELAKTYQAFLAEDTRGTRLAHMIDMDQLTQQPDLIFDGAHLRDMILPDAILLPFSRFLHQRLATAMDKSPSLSVLPRAKFLDKFSFRGVQYSTAGSRTRNSHVLFRPPKLESSESLTSPGQIIYAFLHPQINAHCAREDKGQVHYSSMCLCIRPYVPVQPELSDVDKSYRRFGFAGGFLSAQTPGPPIIVDAASIISHVAVTPLEIRGYKVLHVLPMDRLMQMQTTCAESDEVDSPNI